MKKKLKSILFLFFNLTEAFWASIKNVWTDETVYWSINETFFSGFNARQERDNFEKDYMKLVKKYEEEKK